MWETRFWGFPHFHGAGSFHRAQPWTFAFAHCFDLVPVGLKDQKYGGIMKYWASTGRAYSQSGDYDVNGTSDLALG
jgi:hypothetical protein